MSHSLNSLGGYKRDYIGILMGIQGAKTMALIVSMYNLQLGYYQAQSAGRLSSLFVESHFGSTTRKALT